MKKTISVLTLSAVVTAGAAWAHDVPQAVKARQGQFQIMAINLGILGSMAKGESDYDAAAAQSAADTLVAVSMINQGPNWPAGTDNASIDGTRALPKIWDNLEDVVGKWQAFGEAAKVMQAAAGTGKDALGPALGQVGGTCGACHDAYRAPAN